MLEITDLFGIYNNEKCSCLRAIVNTCVCTSTQIAAFVKSKIEYITLDRPNKTITYNYKTFDTGL